MALIHTFGKALIYGFVLTSLVAAAAHSDFDQKLDRSWKRYRNTEYGYCVSYPSRWLKGEAFEGAGLFVETGMKKFTRPVGAIDFEALASETKDARSVSISLEGSLQDHLEGLQKFERAERMEILEKRDMNIQGSPALFIKHKYYDPQERATWMEEVLFVKRNQTVFRFELDCQADQIERFAPIFEYLLSTLQFNCPN
jgi:hypothetical protein